MTTDGRLAPLPEMRTLGTARRILAVTRIDDRVVGLQAGEDVKVQKISARALGARRLPFRGGNEFDPSCRFLQRALDVKWVSPSR